MRKGFTLTEFVISMMILTLIMGMVWSVYNLFPKNDSYIYNVKYFPYNEVSEMMNFISKILGVMENVSIVSTEIINGTYRTSPDQTKSAKLELYGSHAGIMIDFTIDGESIKSIYLKKIQSIEFSNEGSTLKLNAVVTLENGSPVDLIFELTYLGGD